ncbi:MAG: hypothetical protein JWO90_3234 [Solirubrobacterales bacterium]|jgi:hypothetical protein|nr:hypothetical protein [Solirubrobacterales bacterium]
MDVKQLAALQAVRLKGRVTPEDVAAATATDPAATRTALEELTAAGLLRAAGERVRLTPEGKAQLGSWLDEERRGVDRAALTALYDEFEAHNTAFKQLATAWQQRDGGMNDHADAAYDQRVLDGLAELHGRFAPLAERIAAAVPRLVAYPDRFRAAADKVAAGDATWFLRPIIDSYHTIWFELHEELIGLLGRTRQDEALAGRAE